MKKTTTKSKKLSGITATRHSTLRSNERLNVNKRLLLNNFAVARKRGIWNVDIPNDSKYSYLHFALRDYKVYYDGVVYVTNCGNHKKIITCYKAPPKMVALCNEIMQGGAC